MKKHQENDNTQLQYFRRIPVPPSHRQMQKKIPHLLRSPFSQTAECSLPWWPWRAYRSSLTRSTAWCSAQWWRQCPRMCPHRWKYHSCRSWSIAVPLRWNPASVFSIYVFTLALGQTWIACKGEKHQCRIFLHHLDGCQQVSIMFFTIMNYLIRLATSFFRSLDWTYQMCLPLSSVLVSYKSLLRKIANSFVLIK